KTHAGMIPDHLQRIFRIVLAANREQNALSIEIEQLVLKLGECQADPVFAELDAFVTILPDDPSPQRVVEIQGDALLDLAESGGEDRRIARRKRVQRVTAQAQPGKIPQPVVAPTRESDRGRQRRRIENHDLRSSAGEGSDGAIVFTDGILNPVFRIELEARQRVERGDGRGVQHDRRAGQPLGDSVDKGGYLTRYASGGFFSCLRELGKRILDEVAEKIFSIEIHEHDVRLVRIESRGWIQNVLLVLGEAADPKRRLESAFA